MDRTRDTIQLLDGSRLLIRPPTPDDADALWEFFRSLPPESRRLGFVAPATDLEATARWAANPDGIDHLGAVALDSEGSLVGHVACVRIYGRRGEVAVDVGQGPVHHGLANALLRRIAGDAERQGIRTLIAEVVSAQEEISPPRNGNASAARATT